MLLQVQTVVCHRGHITALHANMGGKEMEAGGDARSFYLVQNCNQILTTVGVILIIIVITCVAPMVALKKHTGIVDLHHPESARLTIGDVLIHGFWVYIICKIDRSII